MTTCSFLPIPVTSPACSMSAECKNYRSESFCAPGKAWPGGSAPTPPQPKVAPRHRLGKRAGAGTTFDISLTCTRHAIEFSFAELLANRLDPPTSGQQPGPSARFNAKVSLQLSVLRCLSIHGIPPVVPCQSVLRGNGGSGHRVFFCFEIRPVWTAAAAS